MRAYIPMVADLFHVGHINMIKKVHDMGYKVVAGVFSDDQVQTYRHAPVMTLDERVGAVQACRYVSDVITAAPVATWMPRCLRCASTHTYVIVCGLCAFRCNITLIIDSTASVFSELVLSCDVA